MFILSNERNEIPHEWVGLLKSLIVLSHAKPTEIPGVGRARLRKRGNKLILTVEIDHLQKDIEQAILEDSI